MSEFLKKNGFWVLIGLLIAVFIAGIGYWFWWGYTRLPIIERTPNVTLQNLEGQPVSFHDLGGKVRIVEFFYANCPDICPTTTANLVQVQKKLKEEGTFGKDVVFVAITFDPERDTPDVLKEYVDRIGIDLSGWQMLTGTKEETHQAAKDFGVFVEDNQDGTFTHSVKSLLLVDRNNNLRKEYPMGEEMPTEEVLEDIHNLLND